jgi:hypothetical protein
MLLQVTCKNYLGPTGGSFSIKASAALSVQELARSTASCAMRMGPDAASIHR